MGHFRKINGSIKKRKKKLKNSIKKRVSKVKKGVKKVGKSIKKNYKEVGKDALLIAALTIVSGGTATIVGAMSSATIAHVVGKNVKDEVLSAALTAALSGSISGASKSTITKGIIKSASTAAIVKKTNNSVLGSFGGSLLTGDIKDSKDFLKHISRDITTDKLARELSKKHDPRIASFVAGLTGAQLDNCLDKILTSTSNDLQIENLDNGKYLIEDNKNNIFEKVEAKNSLLLNQEENSSTFNFFEKDKKESLIDKFLKKEDNKNGQFKLFDEKIITPIGENKNKTDIKKYHEDQIMLNKLLGKKENQTRFVFDDGKPNILNIENKSTLNSNSIFDNYKKDKTDLFSNFYKKENTTIDKLKTGGFINLDNGKVDPTVSLVKDNGSTKSETRLRLESKKIDHKIEHNFENGCRIGANYQFGKDGFRGGLMGSCDKNTTTTSGIGVDKVGNILDREVYTYNDKTTKVKTGLPVCVTKRLVNNEARFLGSKFGSYQVLEIACPESITTRQRFGITAETPLMAVPVSKVSKAGKGLKLLKTGFGKFGSLINNEGLISDINLAAI